MSQANSVLRKRVSPWIAWAVFVLAAAPILLNYLVPSPAPRSGPDAKQKLCIAQLQSIERRLVANAAPDGRYPADLKTIVDPDEFPAEILLCPESKAESADDAGNWSYAYIPGQSRQSDPRNVLVYEKQAMHPDGASNVLFVDGRIETVTPYSEVLTLVAETKARLKKGTEAGN